MATLASMLIGLPAQVARADPAGAPTYRALAGGGSATTQGLMDALANVITVNGQKVLASYSAATPPLNSATITTKDPATNPGCTLTRPADDASAQGALRYSMGAGDGCLDFARLAGEPIQQSINPVTDVTYMPYALDGITYATNRGNVLNGPSLDFLHAVYTCAATSTPFHPLLPASGSQLRSEWLAAIDISEEDVRGGKYPCVKDTDSAGRPIGENDISPLNTDHAAILPVSIGQYVARGWSNVRIGNIQLAPETDGRGPVVPNTAAFPDGVGYTSYTPLTGELTAQELTDVYQCRMTEIGSAPVTPVLPAASSVRSAWLARVGITEADITAGKYPCIRTKGSDGAPIPVNDGTVAARTEILPYSIAEYIRQAVGYSGGVTTVDKRNDRTLGGLIQSDGVVKRPFVLNTGYGRPLVHRLYNVIPAEKQRISPWREVFTGRTSLICQNTALIETYGFTPLAPEACGGGDRPLTDPAPPSYRIRNVKSGKCLAIDGGSTASAAQAVQRTCTSGGTEQRWTWYGTTGRQLKNTRSGQCLAIGGGNTANGAQAIQWPCGTGNEQQWILQADPAGAQNRLKNLNSSLVLSVSGGGSTADGAKVIQWAVNNGPEQGWTLETATTAALDEDTTGAPTSALVSATAGVAPAKAAAGEYASVTYPARMVDFRNGRCRMQGWWSQANLRPGTGPIGGAFLDTTAYVVGPKCAITMQLQVVSYQLRIVESFTADFYYDASQPTWSGHNERWKFWGPILGGAYVPKINNMVYLLSYTLKDMTDPNGLPSIGQVWGPKANWCDHWRPPSSPPGCTA
ncbi:RICIN domain-containing protein [Planotetraspora silvatica]|nr:RICIN domain-containing protein [Planotetraspora silvatica]